MTTDADLLGRPPVMRPLCAPEPDPVPEDWRGEGVIRAVRRIPGGQGVHRKNLKGGSDG